MVSGKLFIFWGCSDLFFETLFFLNSFYRQNSHTHTKKEVIEGCSMSQSYLTGVESSQKKLVARKDTDVVEHHCKKSNKKKYQKKNNIFLGISTVAAS